MNRNQSSDQKPTILVAGVGNIFLSDDGFGPEVVRAHCRGRQSRCRRRRGWSTMGFAACTSAYDLLEGYDALVMIDARPGTGRSW